MSFVPGVVNNSAIDNLVQSDLESKSDKEYLRIKWIPYEDITNVKSTQIDNIYYASRKRTYSDIKVMLLLLGSSEECTPVLVSEFSRIYSLPTHEYNSVDNNFRRYPKWLKYRN